jgi:uncharacterized delta-60 repeat protein
MPFPTSRLVLPALLAMLVATHATVASAQTISTHPADLTVTAGQSATFSVTASGVGAIAYQWRRSGFPIAGATAANLTLSNASRSDADYYDVVVTSGGASVTSKPARLSVAPTAYPTLIEPDPAWDLQPELPGGVGNAVAVSPDGRSYIGGLFTSLDGVRRTGIARLNADGTLDATFVPPEIHGSVYAVALQPDGRVLIGGNFGRVASQVRSRVARLNPDGSLDLTFNLGSAMAGTVYALAVQADGRILAGGSNVPNSFPLSPFLVRLTQDGTIDASFSMFSPFGVSSLVLAIAVDADGGVIIGGSFTDIRGVAVSNLARLRADGSLDQAFAGRTSFDATVQALALQADGKIIVGGTFGRSASAALEGIARLNPDGSSDSSFGVGVTTGFSFSVRAIAIQPDGRIVVGGGFGNFNGSMARLFVRLNADGTRDTSFRTLGFEEVGVIAVGVQPDGGLIVSGVFTGYRDANGSVIPRTQFARLDSQGSLQNAPNFSVRQAGSIYSTHLLPGGKILVTGSFTSLRGVSGPPGLAVINSNGSVDSTFNQGGTGAASSGANATVYTALRQPDGKMIITGNFIRYNAATARGIARINADGSHDVTFTSPMGFGVAYAPTLLPDGALVVPGAHSLTDITVKNRLAKFLPDGSFDPIFATHTGPNLAIFGVIAQPDGKMIVVGGFTTFNGVAANRIVRLNGDGSIDSSFNTGSGANFNILAAVRQPDGKIVVGGDFTVFNGVTTSLARLNPDGTLDPSFVLNLDASGTFSAGFVTGLLAQEDGRIVVRGSFGFSSEPNTRLIRLNRDGTRDRTFATGGIGPGFFEARTMTMRDDGKLFFASNDNAAFVATKPTLPPTITSSPESRQVNLHGSVVLNAQVAGGALDRTYLWQRNGVGIDGATGLSFALPNFQPGTAGIYTLSVNTGAGTILSSPAILGLSSTAKASGAGIEIAQDIFVAANSNTFDQVLLGGAAATITADANQVTRISYVDLTDDIVQVEFSGAGTLSLVLDSPTGPAAPMNYNQPNSVYMRGHANLVITGANETTNVGIFSVGRITAVNQALFNQAIEAYDGMADIAYLAIQSADGKFGGLRTANTSYFATKGLTGIYAPGVQFSGPVFVGDINAADAATPVFMIGSSPDTRITGGDLLQANGQPVKVSGLTQLKFTAGSTSHVANNRPAQTNKAVLQQNGVDVTAQVVVNPSQ